MSCLVVPRCAAGLERACSFSDSWNLIPNVQLLAWAAFPCLQGTWQSASCWYKGNLDWDPQGASSWVLMDTFVTVPSFNAFGSTKDGTKIMMHSTVQAISSCYMAVTCYNEGMHWYSNIAAASLLWSMTLHYSSVAMTNVASSIFVQSAYC